MAGEPPTDAPSTALQLAPSTPEREAASDSTLTDPVLEPDSLFSLRKPRNVATGALSGLKSVIKGTAMGAASLVAAPVMGARENGTRGFLQGLGVGIAGAIAMPVAGTVVGCVQLTRGALNTPDAIAQRLKGKIWDETTREWVLYDLQEEVRQVLRLSDEEWCAENGVPHPKTAADAGGGGGGGGGSAKVCETELYDTLGLPPHASGAAIKKAYYQKAKERHPLFFPLPHVTLPHSVLVCFPLSHVSRCFPFFLYGCMRRDGFRLLRIRSFTLIRTATRPMRMPSSRRSVKRIRSTPP